MTGSGMTEGRTLMFWLADPRLTDLEREMLLLLSAALIRRDTGTAGISAESAEIVENNRV